MPRSLFARLAFCALTAFVATRALADTRGCFIREYDAGHLAAHPEQVVSSMWLDIQIIPGTGEKGAWLGVSTRNAGHLRGHPRAGWFFEQTLECQSGAALTCYAPCDGGSFRVTRDTGDSIDIRVDRLFVGDPGECGIVNIAERNDAPTTYRLYRGEPADCSPY